MPGKRVDLRRSKVTDPFWREWQRQFLETGLPHQLRQCEETGRIENFRRAARGDSSGHEGLYFNDSDVYKWLEAASYGLNVDPDWSGKAQVDATIATVAEAQNADGYIGTPFQIGALEQRWKALTAKHELYCIGHLIEAAVAHKEATGLSSLFDIGRRAADHVRETFDDQVPPRACGHQEIELAFARLTEATGDEAYRSLGAKMIQARGARPSSFEHEFSDPIAAELNKGYLPLVFPEGAYDGTYFQDHVPFLDQDRPVGHAVRAMYYYCGALDCWDDPGVVPALRKVWTNLVKSRIYVTGGIGSAGRNEGFTDDYDLPNLDAYAETCAAIGLVFWAARMSRATGDAGYADTLERALYNAALSGVSLTTDRYFYVNPLESRGHHLRRPWFSCACCPPNIARTVLSVQAYAAYFAGDGALVIDLPFGAEYQVQGGTVTVESGYPWNGEVHVRADAACRIRIRVPEWATSVSTAGGAASRKGRYLEFALEAGSHVRIDYGMGVTWLQAHGAVADDAGKAALLRGPLVYCLERHDLGEDVHRFRPDVSALPQAVARSDDRWAVDLMVPGSLERIGEEETLYSPWSDRSSDPVDARFVPYFTWANRSPGSMAVWHRPE
ncbi:MAG: glycoside hydrolase family 127 protein [Armatimonadetes bacterium]|nr:glycoside hydrolase family 127 protein [Armatimonadota bacterium]